MSAQPDHPDALARGMAEAVRLRDAGDPEAAFALLLQLEESHPEDAGLLCLLGVLADETEVSGMAYDFFQRSLAAQPEDPVVLAMLGAGLALYDHPQAESTLRLAALSAPDLPLARLRYGSYLAREGILDLALIELEAARRLDPANVEVPRELAVAHVLAGQDTAATAALEDALALEPEDAQLRLLYGLILLRQGTTLEAAEALHAASVSLLDDGEVQLLSALACGALEWEEEAWNALSRAEAAMQTPDPDLLREVEELLEAGPEPSSQFLLAQLAPGVLHERLLARF